MATELAEILEKTTIGDKLSDELKANIKHLVVFNDWRKRKNTFVQTKDDRVFTFGSNSFGVLGFANIDIIEEPTEVPELNGQGLVEFFVAYGFIFARAKDNTIWSWGTNGYGHLARGEWSAWNIRHKPEPIVVLNETKNVKQLVLGYSHGLAWTEDLHVYGWGNNLSGQCGCGKEFEYHVDSPTEVKPLAGVELKCILAYHLVSYAITLEGKIFSWGDNGLNQLGYTSEKYVWDPTPIDALADCHIVDAVSCSHYAYFLDNKGQIHYCGQIKEDEFERYQELPIPLESEVKFTRLATDVWNNSKSVALSDDGVYTLVADKITKTSYKTLEEYFLNEFGIVDKIFD